MLSFSYNCWLHLWLLASRVIAGSAHDCCHRAWLLPSRVVIGIVCDRWQRVIADTARDCWHRVASRVIAGNARDCSHRAWLLASPVVVDIARDCWHRAWLLASRVVIGIACVLTDFPTAKLFTNTNTTWPGSLKPRIRFRIHSRYCLPIQIQSQIGTVLLTIRHWLI